MTDFDPLEDDEPELDRGPAGVGAVGRVDEGARTLFQHVDLYRKHLMRRTMLLMAGDDLDGAAYVPFIGEADLAVEHYAGRWPIFGADIEPEKVAVALTRLAAHDPTIVVGDCDRWPFAGRWPLSADGDPARFCIADFDAFAYPYDSWRAFAKRDQMADQIAVFFTDGQKGTIQRNGVWRTPDGEKHTAYRDGKALVPDTKITRPVHSFWWMRTVRPWWEAEAERLGYTILTTRMYPRRHMIYWASILERNPG